MLFFFLIVHSALSRGPPSFTKAESGQSYATHLPSKQATTECKESGMIVLTSFYFEFYSVFILEHQFSSVAVRLFAALWTAACKASLVVQ